MAVRTGVRVFVFGDGVEEENAFSASTRPV